MSSLLLFVLTAFAAPSADAPAAEPATAPAEAPAAEAPTTEAPATSTSDPLPGHLEVDCKVPAEIMVDGIKLAQLYYPGVVRFPIPPGSHMVRVYTNGQPTDVVVNIPSESVTRALIGRTGLSLDNSAASPSDPDAVVPVEFRVVGGIGAQLRLGTERHVLQAGGSLKLDLPTGSHPLSVRSPDGTVIWASGELAVRGEQQVFVQVTEGRMPEVSGFGSFLAHGGG